MYILSERESIYIEREAHTHTHKHTHNAYSQAGGGSCRAIYIGVFLMEDTQKKPCNIQEIIKRTLMTLMSTVR